MAVGNEGKKKGVFNVTGGERSPGAYAPSLTAIAQTGPAQAMNGSTSMRRLSLGGKGVCSTSKLFKNGVV